jgi:hypothetical protein
VLNVIVKLFVKNIHIHCVVHPGLAAMGREHLVMGAGVAVVAVYPFLVARFEVDVLVYVHGKYRE